MIRVSAAGGLSRIVLDGMARAMSLVSLLLATPTFECLDAGAGYFVSRGAVVPTGVGATA